MVVSSLGCLRVGVWSLELVRRSRQSRGLYTSSIVPSSHGAPSCFLRWECPHFSILLLFLALLLSFCHDPLHLIFSPSVMGHNVSVVKGVKSGNFYEQGNAINEIWVGDVELISRLPFGDSDIGQAGWPPGNWPKIPWHQFIIPLRRDLDTVQCSNLECRSGSIARPLATYGTSLLWTALLLLPAVVLSVFLLLRYRRARFARHQYLEREKVSA